MCGTACRPCSSRRPKKPLPLAPPPSWRHRPSSRFRCRWSRRPNPSQRRSRRFAGLRRAKRPPLSRLRHQPRRRQHSQGRPFRRPRRPSRSPRSPPRRRWRPQHLQRLPRSHRRLQSPRSPAAGTRATSSTRTAAAVPTGNPRTACAGRSEFALYRCMQVQCGNARWVSHPQCVRLRETDRVD